MMRAVMPTLLALTAIATLLVWAWITTSREFKVYYIGSALVIHVPTTLLILVGLALRRRETIILKRNWEEFRMAGLSPRQILLGLAAPSVRGALLYSLSSLLLLGYISWLMFERGLEWIVALFVYLDYCLLVPMAAVLDVTLWTRPVLARVAAVFLLIMTMSLWFITLVGIAWAAYRLPAEEYFIPFLGCLWVLARLMLIPFLWHRTLRRLDTVGP